MGSPWGHVGDSISDMGVYLRRVDNRVYACDTGIKAVRWGPVSSCTRTMIESLCRYNKACSGAVPAKSNDPTLVRATAYSHTHIRHLEYIFQRPLPKLMCHLYLFRE